MYSLDKNNNTNDDSIKKRRKPCEEEGGEGGDAQDEPGNMFNEKSFNLNSADAFLFHSPYCKLVQKSLARLLWNDYFG